MTQTDPSTLSHDGIIATEGCRRRVTAMAEHCLPAIIRESGYEELEELMAIFRWFGRPEAMLLENPEGHIGVPGLTLEEANALVRYRIKRRKCYAPCEYADGASRPTAPSLDVTEFDPPTPSREEIIATEACRRRAAPMAERCLPAIIREAGYDELEELIDIFFWFGSPQAMLLENAEGQFGTPGLTLEEANAVFRFRIERGHGYNPFATTDAATAAPLSPLPAAATPVGSAPPAAPLPILLDIGPEFSSFSALSSAPAAPLANPPAVGTPAESAPPAPRTLYRVFRRGRMWFIDPKTKKIVSEAPL